MTIALDATYSTGQALSGVGLYSCEILAGLAAAHPETAFRFCYRPHRYFQSLGEPLPANARRRLLAEPLGPRSAALFHGLNQRLPKMRLRRAVATFHDLFVMSGDYSTAEFRARFTQQARDAAARSDAVIAVSAFTAGQVRDLLGVDPARIHVVHHGLRRLELPAVPRERVVLCVGAIQKRKNIARLVDAFAALDPSWRLVLVGSTGYGAEAVGARIANSPVRDRIVVTGYTPPWVLAEWYARASIFAFPSLDEGFGMPVLEAMAAGIPVVTSNRSAMPEVAGDAAVLVDPTNVEELATALSRLAGDRQWRESLAQKGIERARLFNWQRAYDETWAVYGRVLG